MTVTALDHGPDPELCLMGAAVRHARGDDIDPWEAGRRWAWLSRDARLRQRVTAHLLGLPWPPPSAPSPSNDPTP